MKPHEISRLASYQIARLIEKGIEVDRLRAEWLRREALEYPQYRTAAGIASLK